MTAQRVLLIEDNPVTRSLVISSLRGDDLAVIEASNGEEGVACARRDAPDAVLLDLSLPDVSGFVVMEQLRRALSTRVPILAMAGLLNEGDERRLSSAGFDDVVSKPMDPTRLREAVLVQLRARGSLDAGRFGDRRRLLVVDDDPLQRKLALLRLTRLGFEVTCVDNGVQALESAMARRPDAIISDVLMPQMDGFELCARLRGDRSFSATTIILLTNSYLDESDRVLARRVGADAYVHREPDLRTLIEVLQTAFTQGPKASSSIVESELQRERAERASRQLDKQVAINTSISQRAAILSAEIAILEGLARALAENRDADSAIESALSACFDAGRIAWGVMLTRDSSGALGNRSVGLRDLALREALPTVVGRFERGEDVRKLSVLSVASLFDIDRPGHVLIAPMLHHEQWLGAMLFGVDDLPSEDQRSFASVVASQSALVLALSGSFRELQRATQAERERVHVLESILNTIREPIMVVDREVRPIQWNNAAAPMTELVSQIAPAQWPEAMGLFHSDMSTRLRTHELPVIRALEGEEVDAHEVFSSIAGQEPVWLSVSARPVRDDGAQITGAVVTARDITVEKRAHAQQITSDRLASVGVLAAGVAHEINNPLTSIIAELEMALEDLDPAHPGYERVQTAHDAALRVRTISSDLKTLSRGDNDALEPMSLTKVLEVAVRMAAPEWRKRAKVECDFADLPEVLGNESRFVQVFLNLIVNAAQAMAGHNAREQRITVRARAEESGAVTVEVSDTGCGMTPEVKARIFTPFFTTKPVGTGTGLGLSISHRIVSDAGGRMECDSMPGKGTTFRVWFPAMASTRSQRGLKPLRDEAREIYLLESDPLWRQLVARAIGNTRPVVVIESLEEALTLSRPELAYTLILCASSDAQVAGEEALARLSERAHAVALLGGASVPWLQRYRSLRKPFDAGAVKQFVRELIKAPVMEGSNA